MHEGREGDERASGVRAVSLKEGERKAEGGWDCEGELGLRVTAAVSVRVNEGLR